MESGNSLTRGKERIGESAGESAGAGTGAGTDAGTGAKAGPKAAGPAAPKLAASKSATPESAAPEPSLRETVYENLRFQLITGRIAPGVAISTRGLARQLGVSQMPVRDALSRLAAEGAVEIRNKRAVMVPAMTHARFEDIMRCRLLLEPSAAIDALPHIDAARLQRIRAADHATDEAIGNGDINIYMESNFLFHSLIYRASPFGTLNRLIEMLWMQFGPFMRLVYGRMGTATLVDQHRVATAAIAAGNADLLKRAIHEDIMDGMRLIREQAQA